MELDSFQVAVLPDSPDLLGATAAMALLLFAPALPLRVAWECVLLAEGVGWGIGLLAGALPVWSAARLDPIEALRAE